VARAEIGSFCLPAPLSGIRVRLRLRNRQDGFHDFSKIPACVRKFLCDAVVAPADCWDQPLNQPAAMNAVFA
jgi:hypothetical protein